MSVVRSSTVCRARKTLPCQRNHFTRCSWAATSGAVSGGTRRPLASWVSTVMRIVRWNQSSRCSACGLRWRGRPGDVFAAVGEEGDLLVGLHPLGGKHVELAVVGLHV